MGIRVNVVAPGLIESDMIKDAPVENIKNLIPMGRLFLRQHCRKMLKWHL
jgi:3-oxoacyl-[acyl-carrier protein] reductase